MSQLLQTGSLTLALLILPLTTGHVEPSKPAVPKVVKAEPAQSGTRSLPTRKAGSAATVSTPSPSPEAYPVALRRHPHRHRQGRQARRREDGEQHRWRARRPRQGRRAAIRDRQGQRRQAGSTVPPGRWQGLVLGAGRDWVEERLFVFLPQIDKTKDPACLASSKSANGWRPLTTRRRATAMAHETATAAVHRVRKERERSWGRGAGGRRLPLHLRLRRGTRQGPGKRRLTVARVPAAKLTDFKAWRFRTADGWSEKPGDAVPLADGLATEFSVSRVPGGKGYVASIRRTA